MVVLALWTCWCFGPLLEQGTWHTCGCSKPIRRRSFGLAFGGSSSGEACDKFEYAVDAVCVPHRVLQEPFECASSVSSGSVSGACRQRSNSNPRLLGKHSAPGLNWWALKYIKIIVRNVEIGVGCFRFLGRKRRNEQGVGKESRFIWTTFSSIWVSLSHCSKQETAQRDYALTGCRQLNWVSDKGNSLPKNEDTSQWHIKETREWEQAKGWRGHPWKDYT